MPYSTSRRHTHQIETLRTQFTQTDGLLSADILSVQRVAAALREEQATWRQQVYTPLLTLWACLGQVLSPDGYCRATVARVLAWLVGQGRKKIKGIGTRRSPYCPRLVGGECKSDGVRWASPPVRLYGDPDSSADCLRETGSGWRWRDQARGKCSRFRKRARGIPCS
jgi:hypothetical protein